MDRFDVGATLMDAANCKGNFLAQYILVYPNLLYPRDNLAAKVRPAGWNSSAADAQEESQPVRDESVRLMTQRELDAQQKDVLYAPLHIDMGEYSSVTATQAKGKCEEDLDEAKPVLTRRPSLDSISTRATLDSLSTLRTRTDTGGSTCTLRTRMDTEESTSTRRTRTDTGKSMCSLRSCTDTEESTSTQRMRTDTIESTSTQRTRIDTEESKAAPEGDVTTLMIGGLPCHLSLSDLVRVIGDQGFANAFDLVYLPRPRGLRTRKRSSQANSGYSFVNFKTPELATAFGEVFSKFVFQNGELKKECYTKPALRQGYEANLKQYSAYPECCVLSF